MKVTVLSKHGATNTVRLGIDAPKEVRVVREEIINQAPGAKDNNNAG